MKLKKMRLMAGLTQYELSALAGVTRWSIQMAEQGLRLPTQDELEKICAVLNVRPSHIFSKIESLELSHE